MSTIERRFFAGDSLPQALMAAARHFGLAPEEVAYRAVEKRHGFVRTRRRVLIEVDPAAPRAVRPAPPATRPAIAESPPAPARPVVVVAPERAEVAVPAIAAVAPESVSVGEAGEQEAPAAVATEAMPALSDVERVAAVAEAVRRICAVADLRVEPQVRLEGDQVVVALDGEDEEVLAEDDGEVRGAFEHLIPRAARGVAGELIAVRVEGVGDEELSEAALQRLALEAAAEVRRTGRAKTLQPLPPAARRVVHVTLSEEEGVRTDSEGDGFYKRVTVRLA